MLRQLASGPALVGAAAIMLLGLLKLQSLGEFAGLIDTHGLISRPWAASVATATAWSELIIGAAAVVLLLSDRRPAAAWLLAAFLATLTAYTLLVAADPPASPVGCGCGWSKAPVENWWAVVGRNSLLTAGAVLAAFILRASGAAPRRASRPQPTPDGALA